MVTQGKYRYFLIIMDDCSRATWIYLLKCKSSGFHVLKLLCKYAKTQFDANVKIMRSNNALEFGSSPIDVFFFFEDYGIVH